MSKLLEEFMAHETIIPHDQNLIEEFLAYEAMHKKIEQENTELPIIKSKDTIQIAHHQYNIRGMIK